jgi:hypothetical protein
MSAATRILSACAVKYVLMGDLLLKRQYVLC